MRHIFAPLAADHPCVVGDSKNAWCAFCTRKFQAGEHTTLIPIKTPEESESNTVETRVVHARCIVIAEEVFGEE